MGWHITTGPQAGEWVASQINGSYQPGSVAIGLSRLNTFRAGVLFEQWNGRSIVAHIAVADRMTPAFLAAIFHYPFIVAGVHKIICPIPSDNPRSIALATKMGFREEARLLDASPRGHILLFTLTKSDCRFLGGNYLGKICTEAPARA